MRGGEPVVGGEVKEGEDREDEGVVNGGDDKVVLVPVPTGTVRGDVDVTRHMVNLETARGFQWARRGEGWDQILQYRSHHLERSIDGDGAAESFDDEARFTSGTSSEPGEGFVALEEGAVDWRQVGPGLPSSEFVEVGGALGGKGFAHIAIIVNSESVGVIGGEPCETWTEAQCDELRNLGLDRDNVGEVGLSDGWVVAAPDTEGDVDVAAGV